MKSRVYKAKQILMRQCISRYKSEQEQAGQRGRDRIQLGTPAGLELGT